MDKFAKLDMKNKIDCSDSIQFLTVCLADSVLAFHKHGMQGRSFKNSEVTQEIFDRTRIFKLLGSDRYLT